MTTIISCYPLILTQQVLLWNLCTELLKEDVVQHLTIAASI